jgi:hypothetical protein
VIVHRQIKSIEYTQFRSVFGEEVFVADAGVFLVANDLLGRRRETKIAMREDVAFFIEPIDIANTFWGPLSTSCPNRPKR